MSELAVPASHPVAKRIAVTVCAAAASFLAYSSVYAFRKPFTVATFNGLRYWSMSYQTLLIISQVIGYMLSKFFGIRLIAELKQFGRFAAACMLVGVAWLCLLLFAVLPAPFGMIPMFFNGFALGFLWGIVFSFIEGRRSTDFIGSVLAISFIFAGGFTRSVGKWLLVTMHVSDYWMPFFTGLIFVLPFLFFLWILESLPLPDAQDVLQRTKRQPMDRADRKQFFATFGVGLLVVTVVYTLLTVMRDVRDNYMANIWNELGYGNDFSIFTKIETNTSLLILAVTSMLVLIRKNIRALLVAHVVISIGLVMAGGSSILFIRHAITGEQWMQFVGLGLYLGYIPFNCIFFERLIAAFRVKGNVGFLIYFADSFGYLGSVLVMLAKEFAPANVQWSTFYSVCVARVSIAGFIGIIVSLAYFNKKYLWHSRQPSL